MMQYSVQSRDRIKVMDFWSFTKNMSKNIGENISKTLIGKYSQKFLDHAKKCETDAPKTSSKRVIQKRQKKLVIWLVIKLLTELRKFQNIHNKIIQKHLQMRMTKKYIKKDKYKIIFGELLECH